MLPSAQGRLWITYPTLDDLRAGRTTAKRESPLTATELDAAEHFRRYAWGARCQHETECPDWKACIRRIARDWRTA